MNYKQECLKMWQWLIDNPDKGKDDYFYKTNTKFVENSCYACESVEHLGYTDFSYDCVEVCPISWGKSPKKIACTDLKSPYWKWYASEYAIDKQFWAIKVYETIKNTWNDLVEVKKEK